MGIVRAFKRLLGLLCVAVAALLGLFALFGYFADHTSEGRTVAAVIAGLAVLLLVIGLRWLRHSNKTGRAMRAECAAVLAKWPEFARLRFGENPPTARQFAYAVALGVKLKDGVTFNSISKLIDKAKASGHRPKKADRPSDEEVEVIYHAILKRG